MDFVKNLKDILKTQKDGLQQFEDELLSIEKLDLLHEYNLLKKKNEADEFTLNNLKAEQATLKKEHAALKENLFSEVHSQKLNLLHFSKKRVFKLYEDFEMKHYSELEHIEISAEAKLSAISESVAKYNDEAKNEINAKIFELKKFVHEFKKKQEEQAESFRKEFQTQYEKEYSELQEQPLSEAQIQKRTSNTNIEMKLGKRVTNIAGIVFVLIGVALGLQYASTIFHFSNYVKSGAAFFLGLCFLVGGELMNKKSRSIFSMGITAGGIAILFTVTGISYFLLDLFSMPYAFGLTILISAAAFLLSLRYKSQTIAVFAYIGAFLPIFTAGQTSNLPILFGYSFILNIFVLLLYLRKDWSVLKYISFSLHLIGFTFLNVIGIDGLSCSVLIVFIVANYIVYIAIPLINTLKNTKNISTGTSIILTINTLFSAGLIFILLNENNYENFFGLTALIMTAFFIGLGYIVYRTIQSKQLFVLFLGTAFIFAVLVIPLQFDSKWISLGWLAEAAGILIIGILLENKWYKIGGSLILAFSILCFLVTDLSGIQDALYVGKASAITFSCIVVLLCNMFKKREIKGYLQTYEGRFLSIYKNFVSVICFLYLLLLNDYIFYSGSKNSVICFVYICFVVSFMFGFMKLLKDKFGTVFQTILMFMGIVANIMLNSDDYYSFFQKFFVIFANAISVTSIYFLTNVFIKRGKISREAQTIILSVFALALVIQILICQYDYSFNSMIISIILVLSSLGLILEGFIKRFSYLRRFGLALNLVSLIKFFLLDLYFLEKAERIISYFVLGFVLIGISYVYQYFSKKLFAENQHEEA